MSELEPASKFEIDAEKFAAWLTEKWETDPLCPVCGTNDWLLSPKIFTLKPLSDIGMFWADTTGFLVVYSECNNCGHMLFFNPVKIGLIDNDDVENEMKRRLGSSSKDGGND